MQLFAIAGTILGLIGLAGGIVGYFAKSRGDSIIEYQAREITLRDGTIARLEKDNAGLNSKVESQAEQIVILTGLAQGSPQLIELTREVKNLVKEFRDAQKHSKKQSRSA